MICRRCRRKKRCIAAETPSSIYGPGNRYLDITGPMVLRDQFIEKQQHEEWWNDYKIRAGIEASISELKRAHGLGKLRVRGRERVNLAVSMKVTACNIKRWLKASVQRRLSPSGPPKPDSKHCFRPIFDGSLYSIYTESHIRNVVPIRRVA